MEMSWRTCTINQPAKSLIPTESVFRQFHPEKDMVHDQTKIITSHFKLETESKERNISEFIPSCAPSNFQSMLPGLEQPALPIGSPVTPSLSERGAASVRQNIPTSSPGVTQTFFLSPAPAMTLRRSTHATKGVPPRRFSPSRYEHWNLVESSGRSFILKSNQNQS